MKKKTLQRDNSNQWKYGMNTKITQPQIKVNPSIGVQREVSKEVEDGHKPPALQAAILETTVRLFQG
jgi:hypothetical protein